MKKIIPLLLCLISLQSPAFQCYMTIAKDSCWTQYNVKVNVVDANKDKLLTEVSIPKDTHWTRIPFDCDAGLKLNYIATFTPAIWEQDTGKKYMATRFWSLPESIKPNDSAWDIQVCYPQAFSQVPIPPTANNRCRCDFSSIPEIAPKKID